MNSDNSTFSLYFYTSIFENAKFERRGHLTFRIILVLSGTLEMQIGDRPYEIPAGSGVFIPLLEAHSFRSPKPNSFRLIEFSQEYLETLFPYAKGKSVTNHLFKCSEAAERVVSEYAGTPGFCDDNAQILAVLAPLAYEIKNQCTFTPTLSDSSMLFKILDYVAEHYNENINLTSVGAALGLHPSSVSRILSKNTGNTFQHYLWYIRCTYAAKQITRGNTTFAEIAFASGFGSIRSFNRAFHYIYAMTPQEYRRSFE